MFSIAKPCQRSVKGADVSYDADYTRNCTK